MKRSGGVTAFAILFIIFGLLMAVGALFSFVVGPIVTAGLDQSVSQLETGLDEQLRKAEQDGAAAEEIAKQRQEAEQNIQAVRDFASVMRETSASPTAMGINLLNLLLGLAALIAGIGILGLKGWARTLIVGQAAVSIVAALAAMVLVSGQQQQLADLQARMAGQEGAEFQQMARTMGLVGQGIGLVWVVAWNGLVMWFFNRASVKAQFQVHV